jgi:hypothetical protein
MPEIVKLATPPIGKLNVCPAVILVLEGALLVGSIYVIVNVLWPPARGQGMITL